MQQALLTHQEKYSAGQRASGALLSFAVPGLGQIYQGLVGRDISRLSKGIFFLLSLLGMFSYGMYLADWRNVYLAPFAEQKPVVVMGRPLRGLVGNLYTRLHYVGQFWIGAPAWPALWNYYLPDVPIFGDFQKVPRRGQSLVEAEDELNELQLRPDMGRRWDVAWVYTVIAGVLNILVIYDAWAGPLYPRRSPEPEPQLEAARS